MFTRFIRQNRGLCPHPAGLSALHPYFRGLCPQTPTTRRRRQQPNIFDVRLRRILYLSLLSRVVPLSLPRLRLVSICSLFPLDNSPICSKTEEMFIFEGLFLETFFSDNILVMSLRKYIFVFSPIWKKGVNNT